MVLLFGLIFSVVLPIVNVASGHGQVRPGAFAAELIVGATLVLLVASSIRVVDQWEKAIVLRLGQFRAMKGPGVFLVLPVVESVADVVDQRIRATSFAAETCLTKDTVPVNVDAIAFWVVWDAQKSVLEVQDYLQAVTLSAQTALRDAIGKHELADLVAARKEVGKELQAILDAKTHDWGVTVQSVEIRDVVIPKDLEDAMSRQAQAERERQARIILGTAETEIAAKFVEAAVLYDETPVALKLRAMNMLYEGMKENTNLVIVPSALADSVNTGAIGGVGGLASLMSAGGEKPSGNGSDKSKPRID
jgi:regulator of protease activity HflC (stomatin/prohibitin superfamily)